ncbi:SIMPL domain-containing protein [Shewanella sp. NIFS-20-20]|uniref:SIMPL domain-containing protein n=1 Tax=Shewanella sp. NIFS-20-20 TaxID=2853806 RepID=UPI001C447036|nr:SIMPL domain-containing protein [Shewanella sp. NIFS-20-20]MBV7314998.1 SIMPL domain-containing protein [Shewanella sp. NIFS-20-20]
MKTMVAAALLGLGIFAGLLGLGYQASTSIMATKMLDRSVTVKGLAQMEVNANIAIWPIPFTAVDNNLNQLYQSVSHSSATIIAFLKEQGFSDDEITQAMPAIDDRQAQGYSDPNVRFRYSAKTTISVYSNDVDKVRRAQQQILQLLQHGISFATDGYNSRVQYLYTQLNDVKPEMIQLATQNAREVAEKFAKDSQSQLGKIKQASQGQFSISDRDSNSPHIKQIRVVSTITYYLSD